MRGRTIGRLTLTAAVCLALVSGVVSALPIGPAIGGPAPAAADTSGHPLQWYLPAVQAPAAWERSLGGGVVVAVVDTGVDHGHPDLFDAMWRDPSTGYAGYDHLYRMQRTYVDPTRDWHGTAVAGIVAARGNGRNGIAGVAPAASIMVMRIYESSVRYQAPRDGGSTAIAAAGIRDASRRGADVILLPWGTATADPDLRAAVLEARVPVVAAAGNDGVDFSGPRPVPVRYPAFYRLPNLVTVAASDQISWLLEGSNHGFRHVEIAAPGEDIYTVDAGAGHLFASGTSFAAPQVAGALALARAFAPEATTGELLGELTRTARISDGLRGLVTSEGVLDVAAFLEGLERPACEDVPAGSFVDVDRQGPHARNIDCVENWRVARGVTPVRFQPGRGTTRGQMATFLARVLDLADARPEDPPSVFSDTAGHPHEAAIDAVAAAGIAGGHEDGTFRPNAAVTRGQMASFLLRTVERLTELDLPARPWFDDIAGSTHRDAIVGARELGITLGTGDPRAYLPGRVVTREQMASFLARTLDALLVEGVELRHPG